MTKHSRWILFWGLSLGAACAVSRAEETAPQANAKALFAQLDSNGDRVLSSEEVPAEKKTLFDRLVRLGDGNADGKLSADEFAQGLAGGVKKTAAPAEADDAKQKPVRARPGRPGKAARPVPGRFIAALDKNGDGKLTADEVPEERREKVGKLITRLDKDGDGALSPAEVPAREQAEAAGRKPDGANVAAAMFQRMDANGDGKVAADEVPDERREQVSRMIRRADRDGDGLLSQEEFAAVAKQRAQAVKMRVEKTGEKPAPASAAKTAAAGKKKKPGKVQAMPASLFRAVDKDRDGSLNGDEISGASEAIKSLDKNGDGTVTAKEIARGDKPKGKQPGDGKKKPAKGKKPNK